MPLYNPSSGGVSDGGTLSAGLTFPVAGLHILDTNGTHDLVVSPGSDLTSDRTLTVVTGDSNRSLTLSGDATLAGSNTGDQNTFGTISVSGQSDVVADSVGDTLTLVAGSNITITTSAGGDSITIASSGGGSGATTALDNLSSVAINAALVLATSDAFALGSSTKMWSDLFLAGGGVVNWNNGAITISQVVNDLFFESSGDFYFGGAILPTVNDSDALGDASHGFSDLFLASGALINVANGNAVITHSSGVFTVSTGDLRVTTAGTNSASVLTLNGTQTTANKTLTAPTIAASTMSGSHQVTGRIYGDLDTLTDGATITIDFALGNKFTVTLGGNRTIAFSNDVAGQVIAIRLKQDGTGSRTITWPAGISWAGGSAPTLTTTANKADWIMIVPTTAGSAYDGAVLSQNH